MCHNVSQLSKGYNMNLITVLNSRLSKFQPTTVYLVGALDAAITALVVTILIKVIH